jgi:hypothetical protein
MNLITQDPAPLDENTRIIPLTKGFVTLVDKDDYEFLSSWKWHVVMSRGPYACRCWPKDKLVYMAREILGLFPGDPRMADHINHNTLDNRRSNLRIVTCAQNNRNTLTRKDNTSGCRGVTWHKPLRKWRVQIGVNGKKLHVGVYVDLKDAALAYDEAARRLFGEFAQTNF